MPNGVWQIIVGGSRLDHPRMALRGGTRRGRRRSSYREETRWPWQLHPQGARPTVLGLDHDNYEARFVSTESGREYALGRVTPDAEGAWMLPLPPLMHDLPLILQRPAS